MVGVEEWWEEWWEETVGRMVGVEEWWKMKMEGVEGGWRRWEG